jgi:diadenylate cyclase
VRVEGDVTSDLLVTIFFIHSPLHDGAAIIRGNKILAAGCVLPLSDSPKAAGRGTRHQAALGITEQTDAACVVVSEETGTISIARAGHLTQNVRPERLAQFIQTFYRADQPEARLAAAGSR